MDPKDDDQSQHLVAISSYLLGSGGWNGTTSTQLVVITFSRSKGNAHRITHRRSDQTISTTTARGQDASRAVLPEKVQTTAMQKRATTVLDLPFITFQTYLPSEPSARAEGLTTVEAPLRASKNVQESLTTLRSRRQKLLSSLRTLISSLVSSDNAFATEVAQILQTTQVKNNCTDKTLL